MKLKIRQKPWALTAILFMGLSANAPAVIYSDNPTFLLPMNCSELLADPGPYLAFFEAVGRGQASVNKNLSQRIFKILSLRELLNKKDEKSRVHNPIDNLVKSTLCYYRETKDQLKAVAFDDPALSQYLKDSIGQLESRVKDSILQAEIERQGREDFEKRLLENQGTIDTLQLKAQSEAEKDYRQLSTSAQRKLRKN